jgi:phage/plasmid-like protein (TIGR03299 family)
MSDYFESGFTVREPAWHGKGKVADRYPADWDEAREWAGLTWEPELQPVYGRDDDGTYAELADFRRVVRSDTHATLAVRSDSYTLIDHKAMGEIVEAILEQPNVKYETAGSVHGGKKVWALAYLDEPVTIPGDNSVTLPFLSLTNHHDGTGGCRAASTSVKIVCANTFSAAESEGERNNTIFTFRHSANWRDRVEEARDVIRGVRADFDRYVKTAEELLGVAVTPTQKEVFVTRFIPAPPDGLVSDRVMRNVEEARTAVRTILASPTSDGIGDTAWGLVQAAGEYLDHYRRYRSMDSYFQRQLLRPEPLKTKAISLVREVVTA